MSRVAVSTVVVCYEVVMMLAYASFGQDVTENVLKGMAETLPMVATIPARRVKDRVETSTTCAFRGR